MLRRFVGALLVVVLVGGSLNAAEVKGTVTKNDPGKGLLAVKTGDQTKEFTVEKGCACECPFGMSLKEGLKNFLFKVGMPVTVTYDSTDGKEVVTKVKSAVQLQK